jgi:hypothetical protein
MTKNSKNDSQEPLEKKMEKQIAEEDDLNKRIMNNLSKLIIPRHE